MSIKLKSSNLISVIIPCFNSGRTLKRTISSIKNQSWFHKEIILVNDGSTDDFTIQIINELKDEKILKLINQENSGLASARNTGVKNSSGNYLFFLDADDWVDPKTLEMMHKYLEKNIKYGYVFSDIYLEGERKGFSEKEFNLFEQLFLNHIPYSIFISKQEFVNNGFYDEKMISGYEDWELNLRLASNNVFGKRIPIPLFHYNVQNSGMLLSKSVINHIKIWKSIRVKNKTLYEFKSLLLNWWFWRRKPATYPLTIYFVWYLILLIFPDDFNLKLFLLLRKIKLRIRFFIH